MASRALRRHSLLLDVHSIDSLISPAAEKKTATTALLPSGEKRLRGCKMKRVAKNRGHSARNSFAFRIQDGSVLCQGPFYRCNREPAWPGQARLFTALPAIRPLQHSKDFKGVLGCRYLTLLYLSGWSFSRVFSLRATRCAHRERNRWMRSRV